MPALPAFFIVVSAAWACPKYNRDLYPNWLDADNDCQNARAEVLIRDSKVAVTFRNGGVCTVDSGLWEDPYTGQSFLAAAEVEIDHVVALAEAHRSKAWTWTAEEKTRFAYFLDSAYHLLPVASSAYLPQGDKDPAAWLPPLAGFHAEYAAIWMKIKRHWNLTADSAELSALHALLPNAPAASFPLSAPEDTCTDAASLLPRRMAGTPDFFRLLPKWMAQGRRLDGRRVLKIGDEP
jgi:hypothetical protein